MRTTTPAGVPAMASTPASVRGGRDTPVHVCPSQCMMLPEFQAQTSSGRWPQTPWILGPIGIGFHAVQPVAAELASARAGQIATARAGLVGAGRRGNQTPCVVRWIAAAPATATASTSSEPVFARRLTTPRHYPPAGGG